MKILSEEPWVEYIIKTFFQTLNTQEKPDIDIAYGKEIEKNGLVFFKGEKCKKNIIFNNEKIPVHHENKNKKASGEIIIKYEDGEPAVFFDKDKNIIYSKIDIPQTCYVLLTRKEEINSPKDELNRFQFNNSIIKDLEIPLVNIYFDLIFYFIQILSKNLGKDIQKKNFWPNNAPYAVCLTHDVDNVYKWYLKKVLSYFIKKRKIQEVLKSIGKKEYWNFEKIMNIENEFNVKSTFFFLAIKKDTQPRYNVKRLNKELQKLNECGWEIGLHTGVDSYNSYPGIRKEIEKIENTSGKKIKGVRSHLLKFDEQKTWPALEKNNILYDSTLGYSHDIGFRCGICHPFNAFDFNENKELNLIEIPMVFMDNILEREDAEEKIDKIIKIVKKYNGLITFIWHLRVFDEKDFSKYTNFYKQMLNRFKQDKAFIGRCEDIIDIYNKNKKAIEERDG